ncbi:TPA: hypothetical protein JD771_002471 [Legionella pneumophila subsp. pneumophila]|nr:hypothetical protein [Legionella pneumophila subsp. pneumophila]
MNKLDILLLQKNQLIHDEKYHRDIFFLKTQDKVKHIVLHLAKYLGKLCEEQNKDIVFSDVLICCLALGNSLRKVLKYNYIKNERGFPNFIYEYTVSLGRMAKACESLDHLEDYPSFTTLFEEANNIFSITLSYLHEVDIDSYKLIKDRWSYLEKSYFL